jgi:hypothetical protein
MAKAASASGLCLGGDWLRRGQGLPPVTGSTSGASAKIAAGTIRCFPHTFAGNAPLHGLQFLAGAAFGDDRRIAKDEAPSSPDDGRERVKVTPSCAKCLIQNVERLVRKICDAPDFSSCVRLKWSDNAQAKTPAIPARAIGESPRTKPVLVASI